MGRKRRKLQKLWLAQRVSQSMLAQRLNTLWVTDWCPIFEELRSTSARPGRDRWSLDAFRSLLIMLIKSVMILSLIQKCYPVSCACILIFADLEWSGVTWCHNFLYFSKQNNPSPEALRLSINKWPGTSKEALVFLGKCQSSERCWNNLEHEGHKSIAHLLHESERYL